MSAQEQQLFFIAGCQRSGTTMLRLVMDSHPRVRCFDESLSYSYLSQGRSNLAEIGEAQTNGLLVGLKIPRFTEQLTWQRHFDPDYGNFEPFYRGEKTLFLVRNVCDVVASMMTLRAGSSQSWIELYPLGILKTVVSQNEDYPDIALKLQALEEKGLPLHLVGALYWEMKSRGFISLRQKGHPVLPLRYESLVESPETQLRAVTDFLEIGWSEDLLGHHLKRHYELEGNGLAIGNTDPERAIDKASIGRAAETLTIAQQDDILAYVRATCEQLREWGFGSDL